MKCLICNTNTSISVHRDKSTNATIDKGLLACSVAHTAYNPLMLMKVNDAIPISVSRDHQRSPFCMSP